MSGNGADHYEVLGVARNVAAADLKRAYFRLAKVHTPEDDPERFQAISEAYRVLSDPAARKAYDAEERLPPAVASTFERAAALCEKEPDKAVATAKSTLAAHGRSPAVRFAVAGLCMKAGRPKEALSVVEPLAREIPGRADVAELLGDALLGSDRVDDAERALRRSLALDATRLSAYLSLSQVWEARTKPEEALAVLDRGIQAGGGADLRTLSLRVRKFYVLAQDGRWDEMERVVTAILSCVPTGDADAAQHAANQLAWLAQQYDKARIYDVAKFAIDAALQLAPNAAMKARSDRIAGVAELQREARRATKDPSVARWIIALVRAKIGGSMSQADFDALCGKLRREMALDVGRKDREWSTFAGRYRIVAAELEDLRDALRQSATGTPSAPRRSVRRKRAPAQNGVAFALAGVLIAAGVLIVLVVNRTKDQRSAPSTFTVDSFVQQQIRNGPKLEDVMKSLLDSEEKKLGRPLTDEEQRKFFDDLMKPDWKPK